MFRVLTPGCHRGFAVVFAEDVPEVETTDIVTGTSKHSPDYLCTLKLMETLYRAMEGTLPDLQ